MKRLYLCALVSLCLTTTSCDDDAPPSAQGTPSEDQEQVTCGNSVCAEGFVCANAFEGKFCVTEIPTCEDNEKLSYDKKTDKVTCKISVTCNDIPCALGQLCAKTEDGKFCVDTLPTCDEDEKMRYDAVEGIAYCEQPLVECGDITCKANEVCLEVINDGGSEVCVHEDNVLDDAEDCEHGLMYDEETKTAACDKAIVCGNLICAEDAACVDVVNGGETCVESDLIEDDAEDCENGRQLNIDGSVTCAYAVECGDITCEIGEVCIEALDEENGTGLFCVSEVPPCDEFDQVLQYDREDGILYCVSATIHGSCTINDDCTEAGYICVEGECILGEESEDLTGYKYVRIDDLSNPEQACCGEDDCTGRKCTKEDPGADIDAIALVKQDTGAIAYATQVIEYKNNFQEGGNRYNEDVPMALYPIAILGAPDAFFEYGTDEWNTNPDGNSCRYVKEGAPTWPNYTAEDRTFVSLGGEGGYIIVEMQDKIENGDTLDVLEIGDCEMLTSEGGNITSSKVPAEDIKVQVAVKSDADAAEWKVILATEAADNGIISINVAGI